MAEKPVHLARKLQQNWLSRFPESRATGLKDQVDDSLTNLNWLPNFDCRNALPSHQNSSGGCANGLFSMNTTGMASPGPFISLAFQQNMSIASLPQPTPPDSPAPPMAPFAQRSISCDSSFSAPPSVWLHNLTEKESAFYRTNKHVKPPFSYADLICMAMRDLRKSKITLSDIYSWIQDNFVFYQNADQSWQNSVRHNLSLNKFFQKVPRRKDEPGKGGFWRINPDCLGDMVENSNTQGVKRRRNLPPLSPSTGAGAKRFRPGYPHLHPQQQQQQQQHPQQHLFGPTHQQPHGQSNFHMSRHLSYSDESYTCYAEVDSSRSAFADPFMSSNGMSNPNLNSMLPQDEGLLQAMSKASQSSVTSHNTIMTTRCSTIAGGQRLHGEQMAKSEPSSMSVASALAPIHLPDHSHGASPRRVPSGGSTSSGATPPLPAGDEFLEGFLAAELDEEVDMDLPAMNLQNVDCVGDALDLTVHGVAVKPPDWWNSSLSSEKSILGPTLLSSLSGSFGRNGKIFGDGRLNATPSPLMIEENQLDLDQLDQLLGLN